MTEKKNPISLLENWLQSNLELTATRPKYGSLFVLFVWSSVYSPEYVGDWLRFQAHRPDVQNLGWIPTFPPPLWRILLGFLPETESQKQWSGCRAAWCWLYGVAHARLVTHHPVITVIQNLEFTFGKKMMWENLDIFVIYIYSSFLAVQSTNLWSSIHQYNEVLTFYLFYISINDIIALKIEISSEPFNGRNWV